MWYLISGWRLLSENHQPPQKKSAPPIDYSIFCLPMIFYLANVKDCFLFKIFYKQGNLVQHSLQHRGVFRTLWSIYDEAFLHESSIRYVWQGIIHVSAVTKLVFDHGKVINFETFAFLKFLTFVHCALYCFFRNYANLIHSTHI